MLPPGRVLRAHAAACSRSDRSAIGSRRAPSSSHGEPPGARGRPSWRNPQQISDSVHRPIVTPRSGSLHCCAGAVTRPDIFSRFPREPMETPCIHVCVIDAVRAMCTGCGRSLDEIARWSQLTAEERAAYHARPARQTPAGAPRRGEVDMGAWIALLLLVIAGLALLLRADAGSIAGFDPSDFAVIVAGVALPSSSARRLPAATGGGRDRRRATW